jgi:hypothetical protein
MITPIEQRIVRFTNTYNNVPNAGINSRPLWIHCCWTQLDEVTGEPLGMFIAQYDFKHDEARRAFGELCHRIYFSTERWQIVTERL